MRSTLEDVDISLQMSEDEKSQVRQQMERLLETNHFKNSRRYPALFRFIVEETLEGRGEFLKERLLGIQVFDRPANYDTAADPIVRVTIAEIRKRIAQYYHEEAHTEEMRIELLPGRYAPEFRSRREPVRIPPPEPQSSLVGRDLGLDIALSTVELATRTGSDVLPAASEVLSPGGIATTLEAAGIADISRATALSRLLPRRGRFPASKSAMRLIAALLVVIAVALGVLWKINRPSAIDQLWSPLLGAHSPIVICLPLAGQPGADPDPSPRSNVEKRILANATTLTATGATEDSTTLLYHIHLGENVVFSDVLAATRISDLIASHRGETRLRLVAFTSLYDLRQGPAIQIGGLDNSWTMRALAPLRFHFLGSDADQYWIADTKAPGKRDWALNLNQKYTDIRRDYAVIARVHNDLTGQVNFIVAGIGMSGTAAAGEFVADASRVEELRRRVGPGFATRDFEAVLGTEVVNGTTGPPKILAVEVY